jgi:hypothetical protein
MKLIRSFIWFIIIFLGLSSCYRNTRETKEITIQNDFLKVIYNSATGGIDIYRQDSSILISDARTSWNPNTGKAFYSDFNSFREKSVAGFEDEIGKGQMLRLSYESGQEPVRTEWFISLYNNLPGIVFETKLTNPGWEEINLKSIVPLALTGKTSGYLRWLGAEKCITNGPMYYDPGMLHCFDSSYKE